MTELPEEQAAAERATRKPENPDEICFIQSRTGVVHLLAVDDDVEAERENFAAVLTNAFFAKNRMVCGRRFAIDWAEFGLTHRAAPAGDFHDDQLCAGCIRVMGDQSLIVFERLDEDDRRKAIMEDAFRD